jgi:tRNA-modifying protein YgfZ
MVLESTAVSSARRPRGFVRVAGPDAEEFLQRMLSNDVAALAVGEACEALLLTQKARVIAPMRVWRRGPEDFLLLTEPELGETLGTALLRSRFAAKCEIEPEEHTSALVFGGAEGIPNDDYGMPAVELLDADRESTLSEEELERLRIEAGTPRWGRELDDRVLPAEAGLDERAISFAKGCFPGQEPVARLRHRGHANRRLRVLELELSEPPVYDAEIVHGEKVVGRVTSAVRDRGRVLALGYVRSEVPDDARLSVGGARARMRPARFERATSASAGQRSIP